MRTKTLTLRCEYSDEREMKWFADQLQRFLNNNLALVEVTSDDLPYRSGEQWPTSAE